MSDNTDLGDRMKGYEDVNRIFLTKRLPLIIRIDGKAFHSLTKDMKRPWDDGLIDAMIQTTASLCDNIQGVKIGYVQSDEISLLLTDFDRLTTSAWFDKNLQKMVSVSASMATVYFNKEIQKYYPNKVAMFDSRAFVLPKEEVCNYFLWRQQDASRNSIQMLGRANFSHKELQNLSGPKIQDKLMLEKSINWNDLETHKKRGAAVVKTETGWQVDYQIPLFSQERAYIDRLLEVKEE